VAVWRMDDVKFWFSGEGSRPPKLRGQTWKSSKSSISTSSSRTSCWRRGERCHARSTVYTKESRKTELGGRQGRRQLMARGWCRARALGAQGAVDESVGISQSLLAIWLARSYPVD
jgi:hypothetical protein